MKSSLKTITFALAAAACLGATTVSAAPPANIGNTVWTMQINRAVNVLTITSQSGPGAPGAATCRVINGTFGIADIRGWYCPATGRIHFVHKNAGSGNAVRVFTGNLSDETLDPALFMSGTVTVLDAAFGDLGEFNFSGTT